MFITCSSFSSFDFLERIILGGFIGVLILLTKYRIIEVTFQNFNPQQIMTMADVERIENERYAQLEKHLKKD